MYPGGKGSTFRHIINHIPPHSTYIEPFAGAAQVMAHKRPADLNIAVDLDPDALRLAWANVFSAGVSVEIVHGDGIEHLRSYDFTGSEFVYCDPPYLPETRISGDMYRHEMDHCDHLQLLAVIQKLPCMVAISGYHSALYMHELKNWHWTTHQAYDRANRPRTEYLWMNYPPPDVLHDFGYVGRDRRQRETVRRRIQRWADRMDQLTPPQHRAALTAMNGETFDYGSLGNDRRERERVAKRIRRWVRGLAGMPAQERGALLDALSRSSPGTR